MLGGGIKGSAPQRRTLLGLSIAIVFLVLLDGVALAVIEANPGTAALTDANSAPTTSPIIPPSTVPPAPAVSVPTSLLVYDQRELVIFLQPSATDSQVDAIRRRLTRMTDLASVRFVDKPEAYAEMKALFADHPQASAAVDQLNAPVNFHVLPKPNVDRHVVGARLDGYQGVLNIAYPETTGPRTYP